MVSLALSLLFDKRYYHIYNIVGSATIRVGRLFSNLGVQARFTYMVNCAVVQKGDTLLMITLSYEALIAIVALCGRAGYMLGKDVNKAKK